MGTMTPFCSGIGCFRDRGMASSGTHSGYTKQIRRCQPLPVSVASWPVDAGGRRFRMFRVLQHGPNSYADLEEQNHLVCAGIELYGELSDLNGGCKSPRV